MSKPANEQERKVFDAEKPVERRLKLASKGIGYHGFGFHNALIARINYLRENLKSPWNFEAAEFPVAINGHETRIDVVLRNFDNGLWISGECKRVHRENGEWIFYSSRSIRRGQPKLSSFAVDVVAMDKTDRAIRSYVIRLNVPPAQDVHYGVHANLKDNKITLEPIEEAMSQLLRGSNGLALFVANERRVQMQAVIIIPVLFTTAKLFVRKTHLDDVDIATGMLPLDKIDLTEEPYVYYHYHQSPSLRHGITAANQKIEPTYSDPGLTSHLARTAIRSVVVVNSDHIDDFLATFGQDNVAFPYDENVY